MGKAWRVHIPANVYDGKYYDYRTIGYYVSPSQAKSEKQAVEWVNSHKKEVLKDIAEKKYRVGSRNVNAVARPVEKNVFFKNSYTVRNVTGSGKKFEGYIMKKSELRKIIREEILKEAIIYGVDSRGLEAAMREFERVVPHDIMPHRLAQIIRAYLEGAK